MPKVYYIVKKEDDQSGGMFHKVMFSPIAPGYPIVPGLSKVVSPYMPPVTPGLPFIDEPITMPVPIGVGPPLLRSTDIDRTMSYPMNIVIPDSVMPVYRDQEFSGEVKIPGTVFPSFIDKIYYYTTLVPRNERKIKLVINGPTRFGKKVYYVTPSILQKIVDELKVGRTATVSTTPLPDTRARIEDIADDLQKILRDYSGYRRRIQ